MCRIPALDGLRGVACLMVIAHHMGWDWALGGWLGVEVFFALSGYLITSQLLKPGWTFGGFMRRRAARLWPALLTLTAAAFALDMLGSGSAIVPLVAAAYAYTPVMFIGSTIGHDAYLGPTWSLAIEMHFYLAWGWLMLRARSWPRPVLARWCWMSAVASYTLEFGICLAGHSQEAYYATPTRVGAILLGCGVAVQPPARQLLRWVAVVTVPAALVGVVVADSLTWWGLAPFGAAAAAATAWVIIDAPPRLLALLSAAPLQWVGTRSYSLYLWHVPVFAIVLHHGNLGVAAGPAMWAASFAAAEMSYRMVEVPAKRWLLSRSARRRLNPVTT